VLKVESRELRARDGSGKRDSWSVGACSVGDVERDNGRLAPEFWVRYFRSVSTAEKIFEKAQTLPQPAQTAVLQVVELLAGEAAPSKPKPKPQFGSAKGLMTIGPEFDEPLEDFKPYTE